MDQFIALIIIWAIISLLGQLTRKRKKAAEENIPETPSPQPAPQKSEIPTIFREIFNIPEEKPVSQGSPALSKIEEEEKEEYISNGQESGDRATAREIPAISPRSDSAGKEDTNIPEEVPVSLDHLTARYSLKRAVIWKEILDKPLSLRHFNRSRYVR